MEHPSNGRTGNKARTYFLYAIGEIFLVVVGILIALQVNNWNEQRKQHLVSDKIINDLRNELVNAKNRLSEVISYNTIVMKEAEKFILGKVTIDSLVNEPIKVLNWAGYAPINLAFPLLEQELSSSGNIVGADSLKVLLRQIQLENNRVNQTLFYMDEFWNKELAAFYVETNTMTGFYITQDQVGNNDALNSEIESILSLAENETYRQKIAAITLFTGPYVRSLEVVLELIDQALDLAEGMD